MNSSDVNEIILELSKFNIPRNRNGTIPRGSLTTEIRQTISAWFSFVQSNSTSRVAGLYSIETTSVPTELNAILNYLGIGSLPSRIDKSSYLIILTFLSTGYIDDSSLVDFARNERIQLTFTEPQSHVQVLDLYSLRPDFKEFIPHVLNDSTKNNTVVILPTEFGPHSFVFKFSIEPSQESFNFYLFDRDYLETIGLSPHSKIGFLRVKLINIPSTVLMSLGTERGFLLNSTLFYNYGLEIELYYNCLTDSIVSMPPSIRNTFSNLMMYLFKTTFRLLSSAYYPNPSLHPSTAHTIVFLWAYDRRRSTASTADTLSNIEELNRVAMLTLVGNYMRRYLFAPISSLGGGTYMATTLDVIENLL